MMGVYRTRDGTAWTPSYLTDIDAAKCIGCGRCFKVCSQGVMTLYGVDEDGRILGAATDDDDDDFDGELNRKIMKVENAGSCIGCSACSRVCPKNCQTHVPVDRLVG
ncbi:MAG: ferredoxin III, nif-specific [Methylocystis sp.]|nr:ferredoxin III, nif-specific [Methylocystis sp.]